MIQLLVQRATSDGCALTGEEPPGVLELDEPNLKAAASWTYSLTATLVSGGVLVTGRADVPLSCRCDRCADWFPLALAVTDICHFYERPESAELDLTPDIREDILINLPLRFFCGASTCAAGGELPAAPSAPPPPSCWSALDKLALDEPAPRKPARSRRTPAVGRLAARPDTPPPAGRGRRDATKEP